MIKALVLSSFKAMYNLGKLRYPPTASAYAL